MITPLLDALALRPNVPVIEAIREKRKLLEAVTRALKSVFTCPRTPKDDIFTVSSFFYYIFLFFYWMEWIT